MDRHVVVWSPGARGLPRLGEVLHSEEVPRVEAGGCVLLPADPDALASSGVGGFCRRAWGEGLPFRAGAARLHAPLTVLALRRHERVHWVARYEMDASLGLPGGQVMIAGDPSQVGARAMQLTSSSPAMIAPPHFQSREEILLRGSARTRVDVDAIYGMAFYGSPQGVRLVWAAVTVTP